LMAISLESTVGWCWFLNSSFIYLSPNQLNTSTNLVLT
jgi:hypothetical protein